MMYLLPRKILAFFSALLLASCGGGSPEPINLATSSLTVLSSNPEISYPLKMSVSVTSDRAVGEAFVSLFVMEKSDDPDAEVRQIPLGTEVITDVNASERPYEFIMNVPASVELPGDYYLVAIVDPTDEIVETDEEDNATLTEISISPPLVPNLFISALELDRTALEMNTGSYEDLVNLVEDNIYNADAASTLTVGVEGVRENETIAVEAFANLRMTRSDVGTTHDVPLYLWNTDANRYVNAYGVDPSTGSSEGIEEWLPLGNFDPQRVIAEDEEVQLDDVTLHSTFMNFYIPGKLGSELAYEMRYGHRQVFTLNAEFATRPPPDLNASAIRALKSFLSNLPTNNIDGDESDAMAVMSFSICVKIRPVDQSLSETTVEDNETCMPLTVTLPPVESTILPPVDLDGYEPVFSRPAGPLETSIGYSTKGGGSAFGFGLDFGSYATADNRGYREGIHGDVPLTIFGKEYSFMKLDVDAQLVPDYRGKPASENSEFSVEFKHAGQLLARMIEVPSDTQVSLRLDQLTVTKELPNREKGIVESTIFVGPIPLSVGAYALGNIGLDIKPFVFTSSDATSHKLGVEAGPYANMEAFLYASVGSRRLPVDVGIEGVLTLLDARFVLFNGVDIEVIEQAESDDPVEFIIRQGPKGTIVFTGPQGKLNLFARYTVPKIKTCKIGFIKTPCPGFVKLKATKNLWSSPAAFRLSDVLFELRNAELDVVIREGQEPLYFQP